MYIILKLALCSMNALTLWLSDFGDHWLVWLSRVQPGTGLWPHSGTSIIVHLQQLTCQIFEMDSSAYATVWP